MLCGTINMSVSQHAKPWWFPWTIGVPCVLVDGIIWDWVDSWVAKFSLEFAQDAWGEIERCYVL
jgi:hypothetical protein